MTNCVRFNTENNTYEVVIDEEVIGSYRDKGIAFKELIFKDPWVKDLEVWEEPDTPDAWAKRAKEALAALQNSQEAEAEAEARAEEHR